MQGQQIDEILPQKNSGWLAQNPVSPHFLSSAAT
jgi:hypothetical protein